VAAAEVSLCSPLVSGLLCASRCESTVYPKLL